MSSNRFDNLAKEWDSKPERVETAMNFVQHIRTTLPNSDISNYDVVDYGCGSGLVSFGLANNIKSILGLDYSKAMVEKYNQKALNLDFRNLHAIQHNINKEVINSNQYDLAVTNMTMHHIKDTFRFISILKSSLKNNGYLYISDLITENGSFHGMGNDDVEHFGFDKDTLYKIFKELNFTDINYDIVQTIEKEQGSYPIFSISGKVI